MKTRRSPAGTVGPEKPGERTCGLLVTLALAAAAWVAIYLVNEPFWNWLLGSVIGLDPTSTVGSSIHFFLYDTVKILLLLTGLMFVIGMARASLDLERARAFLEGRGLAVGLVLP